MPFRLFSFFISWTQSVSHVGGTGFCSSRGATCFIKMVGLRGRKVESYAKTTMQTWLLSIICKNRLVHPPTLQNTRTFNIQKKHVWSLKQFLCFWWLKFKTLRNSSVIKQNTTLINTTDTGWVYMRAVTAGSGLMDDMILLGKESGFSSLSCFIRFAQ